MILPSFNPKKILVSSVVLLLIMGIAGEAYAIWSFRGRLKDSEGKIASLANQLKGTEEKLSTTEKELVFAKRFPGYFEPEINVQEDACDFPEGTHTKTFSATIRTRNLDKLEAKLLTIVERYGATTSVSTFPATPNIPRRSTLFNQFYLPLAQSDQFISDIRSAVVRPDVFEREDTYGEDAAVFKQNCQFFLDNIKKFSGEEKTQIGQLRTTEEESTQDLIKAKIDELRGRANEYNSQLEYRGQVKDKLQVSITLEESR